VTKITTAVNKKQNTKDHFHPRRYREGTRANPKAVIGSAIVTKNASVTPIGNFHVAPEAGGNKVQNCPVRSDAPIIAIGSKATTDFSERLVREFIGAPF